MLSGSTTRCLAAAQPRGKARMRLAFSPSLHDDSSYTGLHAMLMHSIHMAIWLGQCRRVTRAKISATGVDPIPSITFQLEAIRIEANVSN